MRSCWISLWGLLTVCALQTTATAYSAARCHCNGRSGYCLRDPWGLHCLHCQGNTEGRHCERCKDGFYLQGAAQSCTACRCNAGGSLSATCDHRGRCSCKDGVSGEKCDRCRNGPIGPDGCSQRRQHREDSGSWSCFCYGHSRLCLSASGFSVHVVSSSFTDGPDGWRTATARGVSPDDVDFRWSPKHQDLEVISRNSLPVYLSAPGPYLGNQLLSYGQNFSFSLRLDRGVRHPSTNDLVLEGSGLRVAASLGDLRSVVPCGQKIKYSFRLDEQPGSRWRPQLSPVQFHALLQNLTAIKIRATFGENGRGYLDNVHLASARRGDGVPAPWVQTCSCPLGHEGDFCERCSAGFRRRVPADGAFSPCEPCNCRGGSCDPQTGDCYSADETSGDRCPPGATGPRCAVCQEGFYGDPAGGAGVQRPCRPCRCNGHVDLSVPGSCDRSSGECLKCLNNTTGRSCEACLRGFHRAATAAAAAAAACKPCDCDPQGSESSQCDDGGRCGCRPGFQGLKCQRSDCPACFSPVKSKVEVYAARLKELQIQFSDLDGGLRPASSAEMEAALRATEVLVDDLQDDAELLAALEKRLQGRLASISSSQLAEGRDVLNIADTADGIEQRQQTYTAKVDEVQTLMNEMRRQLDKTKTDLGSAEFPLGDAPLAPDFLSSLVRTASGLADQHQTKADAVQRSAAAALSDSEKSLALVRSLMNKENKVKELVGDLKTRYDQNSAQVKSLENQAARVSSDATDESRTADGMLKDIGAMERGLPPSLKDAVDAVVSRLGGLSEAMARNISGYEELQEAVQRDVAATSDLLTKGQAAQQVFDALRDRVDAAKADTEDALRRIKSNSNELDDALNTLKGFDQQIDGSRALADAAIARLPGINATVRQAVSDNADTLSVIGDVSDDYNKALGAIDLLDDLVNSLEGASGSLPPLSLDESSKLNQDAEALRTQAAAAAEDLSAELDAARALEADATRVSAGAAAASDKARETRDAVGRTLRDVSRLLANMNQTGVVDEERLKQLEDSLDGAQRHVDERLRPRLQDAEEQEAAQRRRLTAIDLDIDAILGDIANLEDILRAVPEGCFNSPPIEEA